MFRRIPILVAVLLLAGTSPALAQGGGFGDRGNGEDPPPDTPSPVDRQLSDDSATFMLSYRDDLSVVSTQGGRPGRQAQCGFFDVVATGGVFSYDFDIVPTEPYERDTWFILHCWEPDGNPWLNGIAPYPIGYECCDPGIPGATLVNDWEVAEFATGSIGFDIPAVEISPATEQVVGVPTWLAVTSPVDLAPVTAAAGPIWATAIPEFREAVWEFGNDESMRCVDDVATVWDPDLGDDQTSATPERRSEV